MLYTKVNTLAIQARTGNNSSQNCVLHTCSSRISSTAVKNISLLRKPLNGGSPAMEKAPMSATEKVTGIRDINPPSLRRSLVFVSWSTMPTTINKVPLNTAWLIR
ncbi:hypothetical protein D3C79_1003250 [compost metagenome]